MTIVESIFENYPWFSSCQSKIKACDSSIRKQLSHFIEFDMKQLKATKPRFHISRNPRREAGPWSSFELIDFPNTIELIRDQPFSWQKDVLKMMNSDPDGKIIWIYYNTEPKGQSVQGKQLFLKYVEHFHLAQVFHIKELKVCFYFLFIHLFFLLRN